MVAIIVAPLVRAATMGIDAPILITGDTTPYKSTTAGAVGGVTREIESNSSRH